MNQKFVQIATHAGYGYSDPKLFALDEHGDVWQYYENEGWFRLVGTRRGPKNAKVYGESE